MLASTIILCLVVGLTAGILSGLVGLGGGSVMIPALIWLLGMTQQQAQGTTLAMMVPPIGILAAYAYWRAGFVDLRVAALACIGFVIGGYVGRASQSLFPTKFCSASSPWRSSPSAWKCSSSNPRRSPPARPAQKKAPV